MKLNVGKFTFKVPDTHPEAGTKVEKTFEFQEVENESEATDILVAKKWNIVDMVNDVLKANARSNAYQNALLPYRPSEVDPEIIKERAVRDFVRLGIPEDVARAQVEGMLATR